MSPIREKDRMTSRTLELLCRFDLARTVAPVWWGRGRWPNVDWREGTLFWVGWEGSTLVWRSVTQVDPTTLNIDGAASPDHDREWSTRLLGVGAELPAFADPVLSGLATRHAGMGMWSAGSLYEGFVSSIVGQSISVASAAVTEGRLSAIFHPGLELAGRTFWPAPRPEQLAAAEIESTLASGVTRVRAAALREVGRWFSEQQTAAPRPGFLEPRTLAESLLRIRGVGRWTVESALLWGVGDPDAHPTGDVALLRAARAHFPGIATLADLDRHAEAWRPHRAWAARLLWVDLLGFPGG
jgi:3-methyladenine DNA glycosylase/8-oxoguanine DNA glycosylase